MISEKIIYFLKGLEFKGSLPKGISIMNPFRDNPEIIPVISEFYTKFYNDDRQRHLILGINPGRFGAGVTGIPFTDTIRLADKCGLSVPGLETFETSSVFVYEMIDAFGGARKFYSEFFISSVCPLGFTSAGLHGKAVNYNYYDNDNLTNAVMDFMIDSLKKQLEFGILRDICFCLGTGKNYKFLLKLNNRFNFFDKILPLEHPRYIMQYKSRQKQLYIDKYIQVLQKT
jgi:hypothetical protein